MVCIEMPFGGLGTKQPIKYYGAAIKAESSKGEILLWKTTQTLVLTQKDR